MPLAGATSTELGSGVIEKLVFDELVLPEKLAVTNLIAFSVEDAARLYLAKIDMRKAIECVVDIVA